MLSQQQRQVSLHKKKKKKKKTQQKKKKKKLFFYFYLLKTKKKKKKKSTTIDEESEGEGPVNMIFESLCEVEGGIELQPNESNRSITIAGKCIARQQIQQKKTIMNINGCIIGMSNFPFVSVHPVLPNGTARLPLY